MRRDGSHYELMAGGPGGNSLRRTELPVEIGCRLARRGFFDAIRYAPSAATRPTTTPPGSEILAESDPPGDQNPALIASACPTSNRPGSVENGRVSARTGEENSAMYSTECAFSKTTGGGDCFSLCLEQDIGHRAYSQRLPISSAMTPGDLELYRAIITQWEAEFASSAADQAGGVPISEIRIERPRIGIAEMVFRRAVSDVVSL